MQVTETIPKDRKGIFLHRSIVLSVLSSLLIFARYATVSDYDFNANKMTSFYGLMFTIMTWDETTRIGCAISRNFENNEGFVTVMYAPGVGTHDPAEYQKHVHRPLGLSSNRQGLVFFLALFKEACQTGFTGFFSSFGEEVKKVKKTGETVGEGIFISEKGAR